MNKALFLDRDGVINIDTGYLYEIDKFCFVDGIKDLIKDAICNGYLPIVVTNQSGIGRGYYSIEDFEKITEYMLSEFKRDGIYIDREQIYFCPHTPEENCSCRKPKNGMFEDAIKRWSIDRENSIMIGDKKSDIKAAKDSDIGRCFLHPKNTPIASSLAKLHKFYKKL